VSEGRIFDHQTKGLKGSVTADRLAAKIDLSTTRMVTVAFTYQSFFSK